MRATIILSAQRYLNVPYVVGGRSPMFSLDCWGFLMCVCHDVGLSAPNISRSRYDNFAPAVFSALHGMGFVEVRDPLDGDLLIKVESICRGHTGIKVGTEVIQTTEAGVMRTKIKGRWQGFQFPGVE